MNDYGSNGLSASDVALLTGRNGNNGGWGDNSGWWIILLLLALGGGYGGFGGFGGGYGGMMMGNYFNNDFAWLSNGQKEIMQNTNQGFDTLQLANQIEGVRDGIYGISNQICGSTADITSAINNGFYSAEIAANSRQMADMNQNFNNQIATLQGFNGLQKSLDTCCCENRLATCQTQNIVQNEGNATRFADANNTRDIITNATQNTQAILDKLCQLELDGVKAQLEAKNDLIDQLRQENLYARGQASQVAQTAELRTSQATTANQLVSELRSCPIPSQPVYRKSTDFHVQRSMEQRRMRMQWKQQLILINSNSLITGILITRTC